MRKILNTVALVILIASCLGIGYVLNIQNEVEKAVKTVELPNARRHDHTTAIRALPSIQYGEEKRQALDIFLPAGGSDFPVLFFVHGGGWSSGDREMYGAAGYFYAKKGFATVLVDHRLSPAVTHPAHIEDVARAFAWTKNNIANFGGNADKIYICGHSSGAHLVSLLVTNQRYLIREGAKRSDIKGVIAISGVYSLGTNISLAGYGHIFPTSEAKHDASPINFIDKNCPPFLLLYADNDLMTLGRQSTNFHKALKKTGVSSQIMCVKGENHTTILYGLVQQSGGISQTVLDFMK